MSNPKRCTAAIDKRSVSQSKLGFTKLNFASKDGRDAPPGQTRWKMYSYIRYVVGRKRMGIAVDEYKESTPMPAELSKPFVKDRKISFFAPFFFLFFSVPSSFWILAFTEMMASKGNTRSSKHVPVRVSMNSSMGSYRGSLWWKAPTRLPLKKGGPFLSVISAGRGGREGGRGGFRMVAKAEVCTKLRERGAGCASWMGDRHSLCGRTATVKNKIKKNTYQIESHFNKRLNDSTRISSCSGQEDLFTQHYCSGAGQIVNVNFFHYIQPHLERNGNILF